MKNESAKAAFERLSSEDLLKAYYMLLDDALLRLKNTDDPVEILHASMSAEDAIRMIARMRSHLRLRNLGKRQSDKKKTRRGNVSEENHDKEN